MILKVRELKKHYTVRELFKPTRTVHALDGVSFQVPHRSTVAVVGESGCGKSTLARQLIGLESPTSGTIEFDGKPLMAMSPATRVRNIQMVFQDPYSSINPRHQAWRIITEPLAIHENLSREELIEKAKILLGQVGLRPDHATKYPHMFSGGQRQRLGIARALCLRPKLMVLDEPVSALDVSIQAQVLNLLLDLKEGNDLTYLLISHDLGVVRHVSDYIIVMYFGQIVETGTRDEIFKSPKHPYTRALLSSAGFEVAKPVILQGDLPSPFSPPLGCRLAGRCSEATEKCTKSPPPLVPIEGTEHFRSCFFA